MNLGNRLQLVVSKIPMGFKVIDIGTDHAYIPIYLIKNGISPSVIATEIRQGPYKKAQENIIRAGLQDSIELRLGPGFKPVKFGEGDIALVAGMGAMTIIDIIDGSRKIADSLNRLILQPMTNHAKLRKYLFTTGYQIFDEDVAREGNKFYEIIIAKRATVGSFDEKDIIVGPVLRSKRTQKVIEYFNYRIRSLQDLIDILKTSDTEASRKALLKYQKRLQTLMEVVK